VQGLVNKIRSHEIKGIKSALAFLTVTAGVEPNNSNFDARRKTSQATDSPSCSRQPMLLD
jgi:hypothetical protein